MTGKPLINTLTNSVGKNQHLDLNCLLRYKMFKDRHRMKGNLHAYIAHGIACVIRLMVQHKQDKYNSINALLYIFMGER